MSQLSAVKQSPVVLVVEDEPLILLATADDLRDAGFTVFEAANADQAIALLETHHEIRILFTDVDMPGSMDGLKLSAAVRDRWPPITILVTSGKTLVGRPDLPEGGRFMPKPYNTTRVVDAIYEMID
ncbi:response regulator [uncultured Devosia sp.]|uniref:response regulator n=1 Tax=uncultured Devosia sp. TaxID=211434 RepID=UPI0035CC5B28